MTPLALNNWTGKEQNHLTPPMSQYFGWGTTGIFYLILPGESSSQKSPHIEQQLNGLSFFPESACFCLWWCKPEGWAKEQREDNCPTEKILKTCAKGEIALSNRKAISKSRVEEGERNSTWKAITCDSKTKADKKFRPICQGSCQNILPGMCRVAPGHPLAVTFTRSTEHPAGHTVP